MRMTNDISIYRCDMIWRGKCCEKNECSIHLVFDKFLLVFRRSVQLFFDMIALKIKVLYVLMIWIVKSKPKTFGIQTWKFWPWSRVCRPNWFLLARTFAFSIWYSCFHFDVVCVCVCVCVCLCEYECVFTIYEFIQTEQPNWRVKFMLYGWLFEKKGKNVSSTAILWMESGKTWVWACVCACVYARVRKR